MSFGGVPLSVAKTYALPTKTVSRPTYSNMSPLTNVGIPTRVAVNKAVPTYPGTPGTTVYKPTAPIATSTGGVGGARTDTMAAATGTGGGVPGGSVGITNQEGMDTPGTGWMAGIKPDAARMLFENPNAFARQVMQKGFGLNPDTSIGALALAQPFADVMNELALIMLGGQDDYGEGSWNEVGNWMGNYLANQMSPTGRYVDFGAGMNNLLNTRTEGADELSALGSTLGIDDPAGQAKAFQALASALASVSLHPMWAGAMQRELSRQGDAYTSKSATSVDMDPYNQWLQTRGF